MSEIKNVLAPQEAPASRGTKKLVKSGTGSLDTQEALGSYLDDDTGWGRTRFSTADAGWGRGRFVSNDAGGGVPQVLQQVG